MLQLALLLAFAAEAAASPARGTVAVEARVVRGPELVHGGAYVVTEEEPRVGELVLDFADLTLPMLVRVRPASEAVSILRITTPDGTAASSTLVVGSDEEEGARLSVLVRRTLEVPHPLSRLIVEIEPRLGG
jgi:hypothetical protein